MRTELRAWAGFAGIALDYIGALDGRAASRLGSESGLAPLGPGESGRLLEVARFARLLDEAARLLDDDAIGLHLGERFEFGTMGAFSYAVLNAPTLGTALRNVERYSEALAPGARASLDLDGDEACFSLPFEHIDPAAHRQVSEAALLIFVRMLRQLGGPDWEPREVCFRHEAPAELAEHRRLLGPALRFGDRRDAIRFAAADLDRRVAGADRFLLPIVERQLREIVREGADPDPFRRELEMRIARHVCDGHPSIRALAPRLGMSVRTLQRRLDERGLCWRTLVADVRARIARHYLEETGTSVGEIAFLLGYSELSAFDRAFRGWTGECPRAYRRRMRPSRPGDRR